MRHEAISSLAGCFPEVITDNFDFTDYRESAKRLGYWLEERERISCEDYKKGTVRSHGFTEESVIQDFPIRSKAVYLGSGRIIY